MKVIIAGSRSITDYDIVTSIIERSHQDLEHRLRVAISFSEVIYGDAIGVDKLAKRWAIFNNIPHKPFKPNYWAYGRYKAPKIRNTEMAKYVSKPYGALIAIWNGKIPSGTGDMILKAHKYGLYVVVSIYDPSSNGG